MSRVLLLATTTGYQVRAFGDAAERLGVDLVLATDRCHVLENPWRDGAIPIRFHDVAASVAAILDSSTHRPLDGVIAVGDRPTVIAAHVLQAIGRPGHSPTAAIAARNKRLTRERFRDAGLRVPPFAIGSVSDERGDFATSIGFPAVVKPLALSGSRGVMRVDDAHELETALRRLRALLQSAEIQAEREDVHDSVLVEGFIEGREFAVEGLMSFGALTVLAIFDKPDPLDGPFFEETIYVTPSVLPETAQNAIVTAVTEAAAALGMSHGPVHAECRVNASGVYVLEVAARPIGGLCARALRFVEPGTSGAVLSFEELLLRHAMGEPTAGWRRESAASGVMMIPIPARGSLKSVDGVEAARRVPGVEDVRITAKLDQMLIPLPEGASYLGFIFARGERAADVDEALRVAHGRLTFTIAPELRMLQS